MRIVEPKYGDLAVSSWQGAMSYITIIHHLHSWEIFTWTALHVYVCMAQNTRQIISVQFRIWNINISVRFLRSSGMLRTYVGSFFADVSGEPTDSIFKCQAFFMDWTTALGDSKLGK